MSVTATRPVPHSLTEMRLRALLAPVFAGRSQQGRSHRDLKDLPDYLLLDIGVDPRDVPPRAVETAAGQGLFYKWPGTALRTAAKS